MRKYQNITSEEWTEMSAAEQERIIDEEHNADMYGLPSWEREEEDDDPSVPVDAEIEMAWDDGHDWTYANMGGALMDFNRGWSTREDW